VLDPDITVWTPGLEPFDENEDAVREADHTGDDPGPDTISTGVLEPVEQEREVAGE
jgi:hypothetical protein